MWLWIVTYYVCVHVDYYKWLSVPSPLHGVITHMDTALVSAVVEEERLNVHKPIVV